MKVTFKFYNPEIFSDVQSGCREVADGATIRQAMDTLLDAESSFTTRNYLDYIIFLLNKRPSSCDAKLEDGDEVLVLRKTHGG